MAELVAWRLSVPAEREAWLAAWEAWPAREIFAHPDYVGAFEPNPLAICIAYRDAGGAVLLPLNVRPLAAEPWAPAGTELRDATTPYGYGGPYARGSPDAAGFWAAFRRWAADTGVVSCFLRRSLFPDELVTLPEGELHVADNVVRELVSPVDAIWREYDHKVRKNVNKARRAGLTVELDLQGARLDAFLEIYRSTMARRNASSFYLFDRAFFERLLGLRGRAALFHVLDGEGAVVSSELVLASEHRLYSFLGGTLPDALRLGANDLLKHAVVEWGHASGKRAFVLGGGFQPGDGIFRYKRAFAPEGVVPFRVGRLVLDAEGYAALLDRRRAWEAAHGDPGWGPEERFFPAYRAPAAARAG